MTVGAHSQIVDNGAGTAADRIRARARELGFDRVGFAAADVALERDHGHYRQFIEAGMHGEMGYLAENGEVRRRLDGPGILAGAKTVLCLTRRYARDSGQEESDPPLAQLMARYARGRDYHGFLRKRLNTLAAFVRSLGEGVQARALCDTAPVLERAWAVRSGLGFIGKNGLLIVPGEGSYCLLGEVVTSLEVGPEALAKPMGERCGSCTLCLDACPTDAFAAPFVLDPRRCVAYATIESRSMPSPTLHAAMGEHLFGCDVCQEVCPYNQVEAPAAAQTKPFEPLSRWGDYGLEALISLDEKAWREASQGSPVHRATRLGLARNALLVAAAGAREGDPAARATVEAAQEHEVSEVRELARKLLNEQQATD